MQKKKKSGSNKKIVRLVIIFILILFVMLVGYNLFGKKKSGKIKQAVKENCKMFLLTTLSFIANILLLNSKKHQPFFINLQTIMLMSSLATP